MQTLPAELVDQILGDPDLDKADVAAAALVCWSFGHGARRVLYRQCTLRYLETDRSRLDIYTEVWKVAGHYLTDQNDGLVKTLLNATGTGNAVVTYLRNLRLVVRYYKGPANLCRAIAPKRDCPDRYSRRVLLDSRERSLDEDTTTLMKVSSPYLVSLDASGLAWGRASFPFSIPRLPFPNLTSLTLEEFSPNYATFLPALTSLTCDTYALETLATDLSPPVFRLESLVVEYLPKLRGTWFEGIAHEVALSWLTSTSSASLTILALPFDASFYNIFPRLVALSSLRLHHFEYRSQNASDNRVPSTCPILPSLVSFCLSAEEDHDSLDLEPDRLLPFSPRLTRLSLSHNVFIPSILSTLLTPRTTYPALAQLDLLRFEDTRNGPYPMDRWEHEAELEGEGEKAPGTYKQWTQAGVDAVKRACAVRNLALTPDFQCPEDLIALNPKYYPYDDYPDDDYSHY